ADGEGRQSGACPRSAIQSIDAGRRRPERGCGRRAGVVAGGGRGGGKGKGFEFAGKVRKPKTTPRRLVANKLRPNPPETPAREQKKPKKRERRAKELGIWQLDVPTEYGGGGISILARAVVWEELSRTIAIPARGEGITGPSARGILYSLQGEMKEKYLLPLLRGEKKARFAQ